MSRTIRVAAAQMCSGADPARNLETIAGLAAEAAGQGAAYMQTPEVSIAFPRDRDELVKVALPFSGNPAISGCAEIAKRNGIFLHLGSMAIALGDGHFANRSILFAPDGKIVAQYDKVHLFDADPPGDRSYRESATYRGGDRAIVADAAGMKLGLTICYDVRFPALHATLAEAGAEVLAVPAAFTVPTGKAHWEVLLRARAIETGSFVVAAAQGGVHENGRSTWGHSMIIDPWGKIVSASPDDLPGLILADLDLSGAADARARVPALANRRPFSLSVNLDALG